VAAQLADRDVVRDCGRPGEQQLMAATVIVHTLVVFLPYVVVLFSFQANQKHEVDPAGAMRSALGAGAGVACLLIAGEVWHLMG
jgi:hypothetical protein